MSETQPVDEVERQRQVWAGIALLARAERRAYRIGLLVGSIVTLGAMLMVLGLVVRRWR